MYSYISHLQLTQFSILGLPVWGQHTLHVSKRTTSALHRHANARLPT